MTAPAKHRPCPTCVFCGVKLRRSALRVYLKSSDAWRCYDSAACTARLGEKVVCDAVSAELREQDDDGPARPPSGRCPLCSTPCWGTTAIGLVCGGTRPDGTPCAGRFMAGSETLEEARGITIATERDDEICALRAEVAAMRAECAEAARLLAEGVAHLDSTMSDLEASRALVERQAKVIACAETLRRMHSIYGCDCTAESYSHSMAWDRFDAARAALGDAK